MKTLKLDNSGDLEFDNLHNFKMVDGTEEIKQRLKLELGTNLKEWFLNLNFGVPWIDLLSQSEPPERFRAEISKIINADPDVEEITNVDIDFNRAGRYLDIVYRVKLTNGDNVSESVVI